MYEEIKKKLCEVHDNVRISGQNNWTNAFKKALKELGESKKYKVYTTLREEHREFYTEWMFDLCWSIEGENGDNFESLKLICEIEWSKDDHEIVWDFQRLLIGAADIKLMIIQYKDDNERSKMIGKLGEAVDCYDFKGQPFHCLIGCSGNSDDGSKMYFEEFHF